MDRLAIRTSWHVRLDEVSALALRSRGAGAPVDLLGVSDKSGSLFVGTTDPSGAEHLSDDLSETVSDWTWDPEAGSQWEGLATDGAARVLVLHEHAGNREAPSHVFGFGPDLDRLLLVVKLVVDDRAGSRWRESWRKDKDARGEALVLLRDGHLLVAKQKAPIRLIEFGPRGAKAGGIGSSSFLPSDKRFRWPSERVVEYEALDSWGVSDDDEKRLQSVNDLAVFDGELYAISRESRVVARLQLHPEDGSLSVARRWEIPRAVENPEGLAMLDRLTWIVADDLSRKEDPGGKRHNIFLLQPAESA